MEDREGQQPGQVISPSGTVPEQPQQAASTPEPARTTEPASPPVNEQTSQELPTSWQFNTENQAAQAAPANQPAQPPAPPNAQVSWTASEFIAHDKTASWYGLLVLGGIIIAALIYLLTHVWSSAIMVLVIMIVFGVVAARKPRVLTYGLDNSGIHIGNKLYPYGDFKSFAVMDEGGISGIWLMPLKRFMAPITVYYPPSDEDKILDVLVSYLPLEQRDHDMVDKFMRKVRF